MINAGLEQHWEALTSFLYFLLNQNNQVVHVLESNTQLTGVKDLLTEVEIRVKSLSYYVVPSYVLHTHLVMVPHNQISRESH